MNTRYKVIGVLLFVLVWHCLHARITYKVNPREELFENNLITISPEVDSSIQRLKMDIAAYKEAGDTLQTIDALHKLSRKHIQILEYVYAYKSSLDALVLSEAIADSFRISASYEFLSGLNFTYGQSDYSFKYLNEAVSILKRVVQKGEVANDYLVRAYYKAAVCCRNLSKYGLAKTYIDSALVLSNSINQDSISKCYLYSEIAILHNYDRNYYEALNILLDIKEYIEKQPRSNPDLNMDIDYLVFVYTSIGYSYSGLNKMGASKEYFIKALEYIHNYNVHYGMKPYLLYLLSEIYSKEGNMAMAYKTLSTSKEMYDRYYDVRSEQRLRLLETNSAYVDDIRKKNEELYKNSLLLAAKEQKLLKTRILLVLISLLVIIGILVIKSRTQRIKYKHRNEIILQENTLLDRAAKSMLEVKNKELTTYTLKLIEKDKAINELIKFINEKIDGKEAKTITNSLHNGKSLWTEFDHRFNSVNKGFYDRLHMQFPDLSSQDLKHCALIKLNFSGKEMSHLLGISTKSVHMARYRIRSKMNLDKGDNLNAFIAGF